MNENIIDVTIAPQCPHKDCGQIFNESNLRLAIYLNGIFFLVKPEKGIIGFTCPRCQRTVTNSASYNDILKIKDILSNSLVEIESYSENEDGKMLVNPKSSFDASLDYLSPFMLGAEVMNELDIRYLGLNYNKDIPASIEIERYTEEECPELKDWYCSFAGDANNPISTFRTVYWFDEGNIGRCLNYEAEHRVRIFPRYHYRTDLVKQIHSLLGINYFMGKTFEQAKVDHEKENAQLIENLTTYAREHNLNVEKLLEDNNINESFALIDIIEQNESRIANDPIIPAQFLKILTSGPDPLGNLTADICNYLWASVNPFENRAFPEFFVDEIDDSDLGVKIQEKNKKHITMAKLVQENSNKQYVQDFLKTNVVDFVEEYEGAIQSNEFSYAHLWSLKDSYFAGLHKATLNGLSEQAPYVMKKEGKAWKMVFNGKTIGGLRQIGFSYLYHLICHPNEYFFHEDLFIAAGKGMPVSEAEDNNVEYVDAKGKPVATRAIDDKGLRDLFKRIKKLKSELDDAIDFKREEGGIKLNKELEQTKKYLNQVYDKKKKRIRYLKDANAKKVTDSVGKAIKRALDDIQEENPDAYQHFSKAIGINNLYQDSLMYRPAPEDKIDWITIG